MKTAKNKKKTAEEKRADRIKSEKDFGWEDGDRVFDVRAGGIAGFGPRLRNFNMTSTKALDYFVHFFPFQYLRESILPLTNRRGSTLFTNWINVTVGEFCKWIGVRFVQIYIRLPTINEYWSKEPSGAFPALDMGKHMSKTRFWEINKALTLAEAE